MNPAPSSPSFASSAYALPPFIPPNPPLTIPPSTFPSHTTASARHTTSSNPSSPLLAPFSQQCVCAGFPSSNSPSLGVSQMDYQTTSSVLSSAPSSAAVAVANAAVAGGLSSGAVGVPLHGNSPSHVAVSSLAAAAAAAQLQQQQQHHQYEDISTATQQQLTAAAFGLAPPPGCVHGGQPGTTSSPLSSLYSDVINSEISRSLAYHHHLDPYQTYYHPSATATSDMWAAAAAASAWQTPVTSRANITQQQQAAAAALLYPQGMLQHCGMGMVSLAYCSSRGRMSL